MVVGLRSRRPAFR